MLNIVGLSRDTVSSGIIQRFDSVVIDLLNKSTVTINK